MIDKHCGSQPSVPGTVSAQRLAGQHSVANALPTFVIAALVGRQARVRSALPVSISAMAATAAANHAGTRPVRTGSVHGIMLDVRNRVEFSSCLDGAGHCAGGQLSRQGLLGSWRRQASFARQSFGAVLACADASAHEFCYPLPPSFFYETVMRTSSWIGSTGTADRSTVSECVPFV